MTFEESCPMDPKRSSPSLSPVCVCQEPATVAEAVAAAQGLTPDREQQVEITAGLIGLTPDEARPFVLAAPPLTLQRPAAPQRGYADRRPAGARQAGWLSSSADHGWWARGSGRGARLFGRVALTTGPDAVTAMVQDGGAMTFFFGVVD